MMDLALERGLAAERIKIGSNNTQSAFAIKSKTLRHIVYAVCGIGFLLIIGLAITYREMLQNRASMYIQSKLQVKSAIQEETQTFTRGVQLAAALNLIRDTEREAERALKRIHSVSETKSNEILASIATFDPAIVKTVKKQLFELRDFIDKERADLQSEFQEAEKVRHETISKISESQVKSLYDLLSKVSDSTLDDLDEVLHELFDRVSRAHDLSFDQSRLEDLEEYVDRLYQDVLTLPEALRQFSEFRQYFTVPLPSEIEERIRNAEDLAVFAEVMEDVLDSASIGTSRKELMDIQQQYIRDIAKAEPIADVTEKNEAVARATVDAFMRVQTMVNDGKLSSTMIDISAIERDDDDEDEDEDEHASDDEKNHDFTSKYSA